MGSATNSCKLWALIAFSLTLIACGSGSPSSGGGTTPPPPASQELLFGDYGNNVSAFSINTQTGAPTQTSAVSGNYGNGFGIAANPAVTFLYTDDVPNGGIAAFSISSTGELSTISGSPFPMPGDWNPPQVDNIAIDPTGKFLYTPDAASNVVVGFTISGTTGALSPMSGSPFPAGASPNQVVITPSGNFLYASDGGDPNGGISAYTVDSSTGTLTPIVGSPFPTVAEGDPDGLAVDATGKFLYAALPYLNGVAAFTIDSNTGALTPVAGSPFYANVGATFALIYSIALSPSGKFLYAQGDENGDTYGFTVDSSTGALTSMTASPFQTSTTYMNNLVVDPSGNFLYVGNTTGSFFYLQIDQSTGALTAPSASNFLAFCRTLAVVKTP